MRTLKLITALAIASALTGCATATGALYSEDRLAEITARHLGVPETEIRITDRDPTATGTYYNVELPGGERTRCFHDGNIFGIGAFSNPPRCGNQINSGPLAGP